MIHAFGVLVRNLCLPDAVNAFIFFPCISYLSITLLLVVTLEISICNLDLLTFRLVILQLSSS